MSSTAAWRSVVSLIESATGPGRTSPAVALLVGRGNDVLFEHSAGITGADGMERACDETTIFDLASLTKPLVTAALSLDLIARGELGFETRVADVLPAFAAPQDPRRLAVTVRDLLRHDSGLPAYQRYFERFAATAPATAEDANVRRGRMFELALAEPLERDPRSGSVYSDIGFLVLGAVLEKLAGGRVDALVADRVFGPLGIEGATFVETTEEPEPGFLERCAATGSCEWRGHEIHGVVQDENAFAMGGIAPHAGLFATARGVHRLVAQWVAAAAGHGRVLDHALVLQAWDRERASAAAAESTWALGWDTPTPGASSGGSRVSRDSVGHLGYTGTSIWIDRTRQAHVVLLTNRIAYGRNPDAIRALRPPLHDAVFAALDES